MVRKDGVAGNWAWWAFLLTGMLTVFVYAKLWRRSESTTDLEFYEMRYSGKGAAFLRAFRAIYLGVFFNVVIMATVSLAAIKIGGVMLGLGRALGETMAVTFVIGNANRMPTSLFSPGTSIASVLANEFGEAEGLHFSTLFALGFLLFVITFVVLATAKAMINRAEKAKGS